MPDTQALQTLSGCRTTRIYCRPDCPAGRRTLPKNKVSFASRDEALAAGYRACKVCKPDGPNPEPEVFSLDRVSSPLGVYLLVCSEKGIVGLDPEDNGLARLARWQAQGIRTRDGSEHGRLAAHELSEYFAGRLQQFTVPVDMRGPSFNRQVWTQLLTIPYGETRTYGEIAHAIGRPTASRAVGHANGSNPVSIIVPCHRVIGASGKLVGYGGGLDRKHALLELERRVVTGQTALDLR